MIYHINHHFPMVFQWFSYLKSSFTICLTMFTRGCPIVDSRRRNRPSLGSGSWPWPLFASPWVPWAPWRPPGTEGICLDKWLNYIYLYLSLYIYIYYTVSVCICMIIYIYLKNPQICRSFSKNPFFSSVMKKTRFFSENIVFFLY